MNWGWKIVVVYIGFVAMIMTLVLKARSEKIELVAPDYYAQEVAYQQRIDANHNARSLSQMMAVQIDEQQVAVQMAPECAGKIESGEVHFYRPSDVSLDQKTPLILDNKARFHFPIAQLKSGLYLVQISYSMNGKAFYSEESLFVP
jgi:hypothetical protein